MKKIVDVEDLKVRFYTYEGIVKAIEDVSFAIEKGETLGIVGETGCGKTVTGLSILMLVPPPGKIEGGKVMLSLPSGEQVNLLTAGESTLREVRGDKVSMVFQEPNAVLNPVYSIGEQVSEVYLHHRGDEMLRRALDSINKEINNNDRNILRMFTLKLERKVYEKMLNDPKAVSLAILNKIPILRRLCSARLKREVRKEVIEILREMGMSDPERVVNMYPHELSGGMQQRAVIAMALACNPALLIADEPTTSLDVTIEAQILDLMRRLKKRFGSSILYITHDMGVIAEMCDRVAVMYAGSICEVADVKEIFNNPMHPYTRGLISCIPRPGKEFKSIRGTVPNLIDPPPGCRFHPRCDFAMDICKRERPKLVEVSNKHWVACHLYDGSMEK